MRSRSDPIDPTRSDSIRSDSIRSDPIDPIRSDSIRSDPIGVRSDRIDWIGSDRIESDRIGSNRIRSIGSDREPIVVSTSVHWHLGFLRYNVHETVPATPNMPILVSLIHDISIIWT